ncbi:hypothetical protein ACLOJK_032282 [Asimina triloba]
MVGRRGYDLDFPTPSIVTSSLQRGKDLSRHQDRVLTLGQGLGGVDLVCAEYLEDSPTHFMVRGVDGEPGRSLWMALLTRNPFREYQTLVDRGNSKVVVNLLNLGNDWKFQFFFAKLVGSGSISGESASRLHGRWNLRSPLQ